VIWSELVKRKERRRERCTSRMDDQVGEMVGKTDEGVQV